MVTASASASASPSPPQIGDVFHFAQTWDGFVLLAMWRTERTCPFFAQT